MFDGDKEGVTGVNRIFVHYHHEFVIAVNTDAGLLARDYCAENA
jgi:hypothetical protein